MTVLVDVVADAVEINSTLQIDMEDVTCAGSWLSSYPTFIATAPAGSGSLGSDHSYKNSIMWCTTQRYR